MSALIFRIVSVPDLAIVLLISGILLIYLEFNRPGRIVYGCLGALFTMFSIHGLIHLPLRPLGICLIIAGVLLLVVGCRYPIYGLVSLAGTACMSFGLCTLVQNEDGHPGVDIAAGILFSVVTTMLGRTALLARRIKRRPSRSDLEWNRTTVPPH